MGLITILDENLYRKELLALRRYFKRSHKYLIFKAMETLKKDGKRDGLYEVELPSSELFDKCYGKLKLKFSVKNDVAIIENIEPEEILIKCYERDLPVYKGVPYVNKKDLFKLKTLEGLCQKK